MPENNFNYSKIEDQNSFLELPKNEQEKEIEDAHNKGLEIEDYLEQFKKELLYGDQNKIIKCESNLRPYFTPDFPASSSARC